MNDFIGTAPGGFQNILNVCAQIAAPGGVLAHQQRHGGSRAMRSRRSATSRSTSRNCSTSGLDFEGEYRLGLGAKATSSSSACSQPMWTSSRPLHSGRRSTARGRPACARRQIAAPDWSGNAFITFIAPSGSSLTLAGPLHLPGRDRLRSTSIRAIPGYSTTATNSINDNSVPAAFYLNLSGTMRVGDRRRRGPRGGIVLPDQQPARQGSADRAGIPVPDQPCQLRHDRALLHDRCAT